MPDLTILPKSCLQDEPMSIIVSGLEQNNPYTITAHMRDERRKQYFSFSHYISNDAGFIDTYKHESVGGDFTGVFPMGLIGALKPAPNEYKFLRIFKRDVEIPSEIEIKLYEGHRSSDEIFDSAFSSIITDFHYRHYMGPGVKRLPIKIGRVRGALFIPAGHGPFPGVVDLFGSAGGLIECRAAQLASRGIASLALAYFAYEDLPEDFEELDLDYFKEAVHILLEHKKVQKPYVGAIGISKGCDIALVMATFIPEVSLAVCINGSCSVLMRSTKIREGYKIPPLLYDLSKAEFGLDQGSIIIKNFAKCQNDPADFPDTIIPLETSNSKFLFLLGEDDDNIDHRFGLLISAQRLEAAGKGHKYKICSYPGAGHLIEPPYAPCCSKSFHRAMDAVASWGGELKGHVRAQEKSWEEMIDFIKGNLKLLDSKL